MRRSVLIAMILLVSFSCILYSRVSNAELRASNGYPVHNLNTGLNYITIQDAINANETKDLQTIFVDAGTYHENVILNKTVSITGEDKRTTTIDGNNITDTVWIESNNTQIKSFTITNGNSADVVVWNPHNSAIGGVIVSDNLICNASVWGVYLSLGYGCRIEGNVIQAEGTMYPGCGIELDSSNDNMIVDNTIENNYEGMLCTSPLHFPESPPLPPSQNNTVYDNNFIHNAIQVETYGNNIWDNSTSGNFWSDYQQRYPNASELNSSGIWDTPYAIEANNTDRYPLLEQFEIVAEFPSFFILPSFTIATVLTAIIYRKRPPRAIKDASQSREFH